MFVTWLVSVYMPVHIELIILNQVNQDILLFFFNLNQVSHRKIKTMTIQLRPSKFWISTELVLSIFVPFNEQFVIALSFYPFDFYRLFYYCIFDITVYTVKLSHVYCLA